MEEEVQKPKTLCKDCKVKLTVNGIEWQDLCKDCYKLLVKSTKEV